MAGPTNNSKKKGYPSRLEQVAGGLTLAHDVTLNALGRLEAVAQGIRAMTQAAAAHDPGRHLPDFTAEFAELTDLRRRLTGIASEPSDGVLGSAVEPGTSTVDESLAGRTFHLVGKLQPSPTARLLRYVLIGFLWDFFRWVRVSTTQQKQAVALVAEHRAVYDGLAEIEQKLQHKLTAPLTCDRSAANASHRSEVDFHKAFFSHLEGCLASGKPFRPTALQADYQAGRFLVTARQLIHQAAITESGRVAFQRAFPSTTLDNVWPTSVSFVDYHEAKVCRDLLTLPSYLTISMKALRVEPMRQVTEAALTALESRLQVLAEAGAPVAIDFCTPTTPDNQYALTRDFNLAYARRVALDGQSKADEWFSGEMRQQFSPEAFDAVQKQLYAEYAASHPGVAQEAILEAMEHRVHSLAKLRGPTGREGVASERKSYRTSTADSDSDSSDSDSSSSDFHWTTTASSTSDGSGGLMAR